MEDKKASNPNYEEIQNEWDETIPAWQIELVMSEQNLANGNAGLMNWEEAIKTYKL
jgi:hypothetical protein